jgi:hypothetical protein
MSNQNEYSEIRKVLRPEYRNLPREDIETLLASYNIDAEAMEGLFGDIGRGLASVGKVVVSAAPTILPIAGTVVGGAFGGPLGAAAGGALGKFAGGAIGAATSQPSPGPSQAPLPGGVLPPGHPLMAPAAGRLLQTVLRPETLKALLAMALGPQAGRSSVRVGPASVPVGAFTNLLGVLANQAASEYYAVSGSAGEALPEYMKDYTGEALGDPAVAEHRAARLYELLRETDVEREDPEFTGISREHSDLPGELEPSDREYDEIDLGELYAISELDAL